MSFLRALEVIATFNPNAISVPPHFAGWPRFWELLRLVQGHPRESLSLMALRFELIKLSAQARQHRWICPLIRALGEVSR